MALTVTITSYGNVTTYGGSDGYINISILGGSGSYYCIWMDGSNSQNRSGLNTGGFPSRNFSVFVIDNSPPYGQGANNQDITQPAPVSATLNMTGVTCYGGSNGVIHFSNPNGATYYEYSINGSGGTWQTGSTFTALSAGNYDCWIRDKNNITNKTRLNSAYAVTQIAILNATMSKTNVTVYGYNNGSITFSSPTGGHGTYDYSAVIATGSPVWQSSGYFPNLIAGNYRCDMRDAAYPTCVISVLLSYIITQPQPVTPGTISGAETICYGEDAGNITSTSSASGGTAPYTYQWLSGTTSTPNGVIAGATSTSYNPSNLYQSTYYRRRVIDSDVIPVTGYTASIKKTIYALFTGGACTFTPPYNTNSILKLNYAQACPCDVQITAFPAGGSGIWTMNWQSSANGITWGNLPNTGSLTLTGVQFLADYYVRRRGVDSSCGVAYSSYVLIDVYPILNGGTIATSQSIVIGHQPNAFTSSVGATGGTGSGYTYQWLSGNTSTPNSVIAGATSLTYQPPVLNVDTWYRRKVVDSNAVIGYSNTLKITIIALFPPTNLHLTSGGTLTTVNIAWTNHNYGAGDYNMIQYKDLTYQTNQGEWIDAGHVSISATTYTITNLIPSAEYEIRVVLVGSWYPSTSIFITMPPALPKFCVVQPFTVSATTCGNANGSINITNNDYYLFYDFVLTDVSGNIHALTGLTADYYFLNATVKPFYWVIYGRESCDFDWIAINAVDTTILNIGMSIRNAVCGGFGKATGRIALQNTDSDTCSNYTSRIYADNQDLIQTITGTSISQVIFVPLSVGIYYIIISNNCNNCVILVSNTQVKGESLRSVAGIKRLWLTEWDSNVEYNYWSQSDEDYYISGVDADFFNSIKIKEFIDSTLPSNWYKIDLVCKEILFNQGMSKTKQGFVFQDKLTLNIAEADNDKWKQLVQILVKRYILIFQDNNNYYWVMGYRHGAIVTGYRLSSNEYGLEFKAQSENKILTNIDEQYVIDSIL